MKCGRVVGLVAALAMFLSLNVFAKSSKDEGKMTLTDPVQIGSTQLKPGNYKVQWNGTGEQVNVDFLKGSKTVATTSARLVNHPQPAPYDSVTLESLNKTTKRIDEIDFNHSTQALVFHAATTAKD
jgi:hypothetical protein